MTTECVSCGKTVKLSPGGFLARHKNKATKKWCDGSGRHESFNK